MTQPLFEDLPAANADLFDDLFWPAWPLKIGKKGARKALVKAADRHMGRSFAIDLMAGVARYKANKPAWKNWMHATTFLNGDHWEDEYDAPASKHGPKSDLALRQIASHVLKDWYQLGTYPREVLQQCVDAGLLTAERMEEVL